MTPVALLKLWPIGLELLQTTPVARTQDGGVNKLIFFGSIAAAIMGNLEVVEAGECVMGGTLMECQGRCNWFTCAPAQPYYFVRMAGCCSP